MKVRILSGIGLVRFDLGFICIQNSEIANFWLSIL